jgi:hypothetical protein
MSTGTFRAIVSGTDPLIIQLNGHLGAPSELMMLNPKPQVKIELDASGIISLNSKGLREFIDWSRGLRNKEIVVTYCPRILVDQLNMLPQMLPKQTQVVSFYVPYYSEENSEEVRYLMTKGADFDLVKDVLELRLPNVKDSKGIEMTLDVVPEKYFAFLSRQYGGAKLKILNTEG